MLGIGGSYVTIPQILSHFQGEYEKEIERILIRHSGYYNFERKLFQCTNCSYLFDHGYLEFYKEKEFSCLSKIKCPSCKKANP